MPPSNPLRIQSVDNQNFIKVLDVFMERYGMSYREFLDLPIPTFYALNDIIQKEAKTAKQKSFRK